MICSSFIYEYNINKQIVVLKNDFERDRCESFQMACISWQPHPIYFIVIFFIQLIQCEILKQFILRTFCQNQQKKMSRNKSGWVLLFIKVNLKYEYRLCEIIRDLTQQDGWKTQDGRMPKKRRARLGMHSLARHFFVILPSCCVRSLFMIKKIYFRKSKYIIL